MSRHLREELSAYVDRRLAAPVLDVWDRHVVVCVSCQRAVDQERALLTSLRAAPDPGVPASLAQMLLAMSVPAPAPVAPLAGPPPMPSGNRLPTMGPRAPYQYRSLRRPVVLAGLVAGASAIAAFTVGLSSPTGMAASVTPTVTPGPSTGVTRGESIGRSPFLVVTVTDWTPIGPNPTEQDDR